MDNETQEKNTNKIDISNLKEITAVYKTNLPDQFKVKPINLTLPLKFTKENLNDNLKKLLKKFGKTHENKNFEFYINNHLIEADLGSFLQLHEKEMVFEQVLEIFYYFELSEPENINTVKEDEWIRKIVSLHSEDNLARDSLTDYCVGLFNGEVSFYNSSFQKIMAVNSDKNVDISEKVMEMLSDMLFIKQGGKTLLVSSSRSENENVSIYSIDLNTTASKKLHYVLKQENEYINCLSSNPADLSFFCGGDTDGTVRIFKMDIDNMDNIGAVASEENENNRKKGNNKKQRSEASKLDHKTEMTKTHTDVRLINWINTQQIVTAGDDFTIKVWNTSTTANYCNFNSNAHRVPTAFTSYNNTDGIIAGYDDGRIRTWDIRAPNESNSLIFNGHKNKISEVKVNPLMSQIFITTAYDKMTKVWDLRSRKPLYEIKSDEGEKMFGLEFLSGQYFLCGGDNSATKIYETKL